MKNAADLIEHMLAPAQQGMYGNWRLGPTLQEQGILVGDARDALVGQVRKVEQALALIAMEDYAGAKTTLATLQKKLDLAIKSLTAKEK
jgi:hypothetical protein